MPKAVTGFRRAADGIVLPRSYESRVLSLWATAKFANGTGYAISQAFGNPFWVLSVKVRVLWCPFVADSDVGFRMTVGVGKDVNAVIVRDWERVIPLVSEGHERPWYTDDKILTWEWTLMKRYSGQGRRLGFWIWLPNYCGTSIVKGYCSYEISEG